jgi:hypothetical protein
VDDGSSGDKVESDGIFSRTVRIKEPGEYKLTVVARGPTFQRTQQVPFRVRPQLVTLSIVLPEDEEASHKHAEEHANEENGGADKEEHAETPASESGEAQEGNKKEVIKGDGRATFEVRLSSEVSALRNVDVKLTAKDVHRKRYELPLKRSVADPLVYEFSAANLLEDGQFLLVATLAAETKKHQEVEAKSKPVIFERQSSGKEPEVTVKIVQKEDEKPVTGESFPIVPLLVMTAGNVLIGFLGYMLLKRAQSSAVPAVGKYTVPEEVLMAIARLEERAAMTDIDLNDPMFADTSEPASSPPIPETNNEEEQGEEAAE